MHHSSFRYTIRFRIMRLLLWHRYVDSCRLPSGSKCHHVDILWGRKKQVWLWRADTAPSRGLWLLRNDCFHVHICLWSSSSLYGHHRRYNTYSSEKCIWWRREPSKQGIHYEHVLNLHHPSSMSPQAFVVPGQDVFIICIKWLYLSSYHHIQFLPRRWQAGHRHRSIRI